jgi:tRNA(fMet)-specific endonuclease VapC
VLDTNVVIALIGGEVAVRDSVVQANEVFIPSPVLGELYLGAYNSDRIAENLDRIDDLVRWYAILHIDEAVAKVYGQILSKLRQKGTPIPDNDIWIAALAQQHSAAVATRDAHFDSIEGLEIARW